MTKYSEKAVSSPSPSPALDNSPRLGKRALNVQRDFPDLRDRYYEPALLDLALELAPPRLSVSPILDQGQEGACTGFALASAITLMNKTRHERLTIPTVAPQASPRMLYEMAKLNDEWPGEDYEGSSIRAALKGFSNNGVCHEDLAPYVAGESDWTLTKDQAKDARQVGLGAYYRLRPEIIDYHAALNEAGVVYVSAMIHRGWQAPKKGEIKPSTITEGGHAFVIIGYDAEGFIIQNSWGEDWGGLQGRAGTVRWRYEDWAATVMDAWVLRLSVPTPAAFDLTRSDLATEAVGLFDETQIKAPKDQEIIGHLVHLDDGQLKTTGKYPTPLSRLKETGRILTNDTGKYKHLVIYAHGGLNGVGASANRVRKMKDVFKRNGIYPIHFMWETGFFETLKDLMFHANRRSQARVGGFSDFFDRFFEQAARKAGSAVWADIKTDAMRSFTAAGGGRAAMKELLTANAKRQTPLKLHLVGHSAGSILLGEMLGAMASLNPLHTPVESCSLMAPACTIDYFKTAYVPNIGKSGAANGVKNLVQYNLTDRRELDDTVGLYRKSLLYFISRSFEVSPETALLGMEKYASNLTLKPAHDIHYAGRSASVTESDSHGGFDNDRATMNHILRSILGKKPSAANGFQPEDMVGY